MRRSHTGLTLLELLTVLAITSLLTTLALPSVSQYQQNQHMRTALHALQSALQMARHQAVYSRSNTVLCPGMPASTCAGYDAWASGWWAFADTSGDRQWQPGETVLHQHEGLEGLRITSSPSRSRLRFLPNGTAPGSNATIVFCDRRGAGSARLLKLSNSGRLKMEVPTRSENIGCPEI